MKLVIGGAYQGKLQYAMETYHVRENWIDGRSCGFGEIMDCAGIYHFHEYVRRLLLMSAGMDEHTEHGAGGWFTSEKLTELEKQAELFVDELYRNNPDILVVSNELGYGVVPMEKFDRSYRETVGRVCTCIAAKADEVTRVVCGIGMRIK